jgi:hypothetical protein
LIDDASSVDSELPLLPSSPAAPAAPTAVPAAPNYPLSEASKDMLVKWVRDHPNSRPTRDQKNSLILLANVENRQLENWFTRNRDKNFEEEIAAPTSISDSSSSST